MNFRKLDMADCMLLRSTGSLFPLLMGTDFMAVGGVMTITYTGLIISRE